MPSKVDSIIIQCKELVDQQREAVTALTEQLSGAKAELRTFEAAFKSLTRALPSGNGDHPAAKQSRSGGSRKKIIQILQESETPLDLGALARQMYGSDTSAHRARITAAIGSLARDPQSGVRRVGAGIYTARAE